MGGEPHDLVWADQVTRRFHQDVVLAHMQPIGAGFHDDFRMVVDNERNPEALADRNQRHGKLENLVWLKLLGAQLENFHSALQHFGGDPDCFRRLDIAHVENPVEAAILKIEIHLRRVLLQEHFPLQAVCALV